MKNMKFWRTALVATLVLTVMLSVTGGTIAWFTDSVTSEVNTITAGNLDIELYKGTVAEENKVTAETLVFELPELWEPGAAAWQNLIVVNEGDLALVYEMSINTADENSMSGSGHKLSEVLKVGVVDGAIAADANREDVLAQVSEWKSFADYAVEGELLPEDSTLIEGADTGSKTYGVVIYWKPSAEDNNWNVNNGKTTSDGKDHLYIDLGVKLTATQMMAEEDSFGPNYDENAKYGVAAEELRDLLAAGGDVTIDGTVNADENQIVEGWSATATAEYQVDSKKVTSLTGGELILDNDAKYGLVVFGRDNSVSINETKIKANSQWSVLAYTGKDKTTTFNNVDVEAQNGAGIYVYDSGKAVLNNVNVNQRAFDNQYASTTPWAATAVAASNGVEVEINGGKYFGTTYAVYAYTSGANVTINDGEFKAPTVLKADADNAETTVTINGGSFSGKIDTSNVLGNGSVVVTINGGNFTEFSAAANAERLVIKGGTFDANPTAYVPAGYNYTETSDGLWIVTADTTADGE